MARVSRKKKIPLDMPINTSDDRMLSCQDRKLRSAHAGVDRSAFPPRPEDEACDQFIVLSGRTEAACDVKEIARLCAPRPLRLSRRVLAYSKKENTPREFAKIVAGRVRVARQKRPWQPEAQSTIRRGHAEKSADANGNRSKLF